MTEATGAAIPSYAPDTRRPPRRPAGAAAPVGLDGGLPRCCSLGHVMGSLIKKRRKRMRKKKHKKMLKATRWQRRAAGK